MGKIMMNDIPYASTYDNATSVKYDNTKSQLDATNVQDAIDKTAKDLQENRNDFTNYKNNISNPNLLINGDFQVWQRGESFAVNYLNGFCYTADRWAIYNYNTSDTIKNFYKVSDGISTELAVSQKLENRLTVGKKYVLSASIDNVIYVMPFVGGTSISTEQLAYHVESSNDRIEVHCEAKTNPVRKVVNWVKLEQGSIATPFISRLYTEELMLCQRYYQYGHFLLKKFFSYGSQNVIYTGETGNAMRVEPTAIIEYLNLVDTGGIGFQGEIPILRAYRLKPSCSYFEIQFRIPSDKSLHDFSAIAESVICFDAEIY